LTNSINHQGPTLPSQAWTALHRIRRKHNLSGDGCAAVCFGASTYTFAV